MPLGKRVEVGVAEHGIDQGLLDDYAVRVVRTLKEAGHQAYIVGGAVRDLLVGLRPKDFDVATDATPEQVKALFRRAFIIGRRFRIVHVIFGRGRDHEVIEVSTFRALLDAAAADQVSGNEKTSKQELSGKAHVVDASGRVLRDNVWGPQIEDAARRDFTVNALYYDPTEQIVVDYHHGFQDAKKRVLRMIGDPATRYREDPVRIIRVVRFAAKLGFAIDPKTQAPIKEMASLLANVPASRMFDEMIKLLQTGHALKSLDELRKQGLHRGVFPILDALLNPTQRHEARERFVNLALADTDRRVAEGLAVAPSFMLACLLWHEVVERWHALQAAGEAAVPGAAAGGGRGLRRAHRRHLRPRQAGRRHARDLADAAALRAAQRQHAARAGRAAALPCRLRLPAPARRRRRGQCRTGRMVGGLRPRRRRRACGPAPGRARAAAAAARAGAAAGGADASASVAADEAGRGGAAQAPPPAPQTGPALRLAMPGQPTQRPRSPD